MNKLLPEDFVEQERKRVFLPDDSFRRRVIERMPPLRHASSLVIWDFVPGFARPMVAGAMVLVVIVLGLQLMFPQRPQIGVVDQYLRTDWTPAEEWLYGEAEIPEGQDLLLEISVLEGF